MFLSQMMEALVMDGDIGTKIRDEAKGGCFLS
jgi:hypothetical protein